MKGQARGIAVWATAALFAAVAVTAVATAGSGAEGEGVDAGPSGFLHRLHAAGGHVHAMIAGGHGPHAGGDSHAEGHGRGHGDASHADHHRRFAHLIQSLELTPPQHRHVERVHEILMRHHQNEPRAKATLHDGFVAAITADALDRDGVHAIIDAYLDDKRATFHAVADELIPFVERLEPSQRDILVRHLQGFGD